MVYTHSHSLTYGILRLPYRDKINIMINALTNKGITLKPVIIFGGVVSIELVVVWILIGKLNTIGVKMTFHRLSCSPSL